MQKNITVSVALCGLFIVTNTTLAMEDGNLNLSLAGTPHASPQLSPRTFDTAKAITAISDPCMPDNPSNNNISTLNQSLFISPIDDYDLTKSQAISQSGSQPSSPRRQEINPLLDGRNEIVYEPILDNMKYNYKNPGGSNRDTIIGQFTNDRGNLPCYSCINSKDVGDNSSEITYQEENQNIKTITVNFSEIYNQEKYITVTENTIGLISEYMIDIHPESNNTNKTQEQSDEATASEEERSKKALDLLTNTFSDSDSEKNKETSQTTQQSDESTVSEKTSQTTFGSLTCMSYDDIPRDVKQYEGSITKMNTQTAEVTYFVDGISQTICVNNTPLLKNPTFAFIKNNRNEILYVIKLPEQIDLTQLNLSKQEEKSTISTHKKAFTPQSKNPDNGSYRKSTIMGISFIALCIAFAYHYNKLPDAFTNLLNQCFAQCKNFMPSSFNR